MIGEHDEFDYDYEEFVSPVSAPSTPSSVVAVTDGTHHVIVTFDVDADGTTDVNGAQVDATER